MSNYSTCIDYKKIKKSAGNLKSFGDWAGVAYGNNGVGVLRNIEQNLSALGAQHDDCFKSCTESIANLDTSTAKLTEDISLLADCLSETHKAFKKAENDIESLSNREDGMLAFLTSLDTIYGVEENESFTNNIDLGQNISFNSDNFRDNISEDIEMVLSANSIAVEEDNALNLLGQTAMTMLFTPLISLLGQIPNNILIQGLNMRQENNNQTTTTTDTTTTTTTTTTPTTGPNLRPVTPLNPESNLRPVTPLDPNEDSNTSDSNDNNQENTGDNNTNNNNNTENNNTNTDSNTNTNQENNNNTDNSTNTNPENNNSNVGNNTDTNTNNNTNTNTNTGSNGNRPNTGNNNYRPGNSTGSGNNQSSGMGMPPVEDNSNASTTTPSAPESDAGISDNTGETLDVISIDKDGGKTSASTSSNDGGSVIPTILGVGVAGAAAVAGAKILHDKKQKENENEYSYEEDSTDNDNSFANLDPYVEEDTTDQTITMSPGKYKAGSANNLVLEDAPSDIRIDDSIADIPNQKEELE